eukprot:4949446-Amphidinium_carterae.1
MQMKGHALEACKSTFGSFSRLATPCVRKRWSSSKGCRTLKVSSAMPMRSLMLDNNLVSDRASCLLGVATYSHLWSRPPTLGTSSCTYPNA